MLSNPNSSPLDVDNAKLSVAEARSELQKTKRAANLEQALQRDSTLFSIKTSNPAPLFASIRRNKQQSVRINKLNVGNKTFTGDGVKNGFYKSISDLKTRDSNLPSSQTFQQFVSAHEHILEICQSGEKIPTMNNYLLLNCLSLESP